MAASLVEVAPNETIDQALDFGALGPTVTVDGSIGNGPAGAADVTWFHFSLTDASRVEFDLSTPAGAPAFASVLSLYNNEPGDFADPYDLDGHRLLAQVEANPASGAADYAQDLSPGDYFVAISGSGNLDFSPVIAGSGYNGATGSYELSLQATDLGLGGDGPTVIASDPAAGAVIASSPLAIRLEMSEPLDPNTIVPGQTALLFAGTTTTVAAGTATPVPLASVNFSAAANELQLFPLAPLSPGNYVVWLAGNTGTEPFVLADPNGLPLGEDAAHPAGADETFSFEVDGIDGVAGATASDDTAATARNLGDVTGAGLIQVSGAIGDDPSFNPNLSPDPTSPDPQDDPANQVDLYHFQITGPGQYAMLAEVFAGRIGSPLDPGVSLFELDPSTGSLVFLAGNNNTLDSTPGTDGSVPLLTDSALSVGLTAGNYYLAVADGSNTPSPIEGQMPGSPGIFDPNQPGSAQLGWSVGPYVLNLLVEPAPNPPTVLASSPSAGQVLDEPPTQITVQFSEPINIQQLAYQAFEMTAQETVPQVFVEAADGTQYYPRFLAYDSATNVATFQMLDGLPNGSYALHLSGPGGLLDLGGNPIVANDPSGDYVIPFQVDGPERDISGNMTDGYTIASQAGDGVTQNLGVLFPDELAAGVTIIRGPTPGATTTADLYQIELLQSQNYVFTLSDDNLPPGASVTVANAAGQTMPLLAASDGLVFFAPLSAGTYTLAVSGWSAGQSANLSYQLSINFVGQQDNAPPLVDGPAPLLQIYLAGADGTSGDTSTGGAPTGGIPSGGAPTGGIPAGGTGETVNGGLLAASQPGPLYASTAQNVVMGGLSSLGASPLGGVLSESNPAAAVIQVAVNAPTPPIASGLVSLITLTQWFGTNGDGQGIERVNTGEQELAVPSATTAATDTTPAPDQPAPLPLAAPQVLASNERAVASQNNPLGATDVAMTAGVFPAERSPALAPVVGGRGEMKSLTPADWMSRLVVTGATLAAAFRGRRVIEDLKSRKWTRRNPPRPARPAGRRFAHAGSTVTWSAADTSGGVHHRPDSVRTPDRPLSFRDAR